MKKKLNLLIGILFIVLLSLGFSSAITGSMGNARMVLYPEVNGWTNTVIEKSILVKNVNDEPINITLQTDSEASKFIELVDKSFILQPHTEGNAEFLVKVKAEGTYTGKINVFFSPIEDKKSGVALSSTIIVIAKKDQGYDEEEIEENEEEIGKNEETTGEKNDKFSTGALFLVGMSFVLLLVLISLMVLLSKKGEKRRKKVNARKKS